MSTYVGTPSHENRVGYALARAFLIVVIVLIAGWWLWVLGHAFDMLSNPPLGPRGSVRGSSTLARSSAIAIPFLAAMSFGLVGLSRRSRNARVEEAVDAELRNLTSGHFVFCGRPWTGETAPRERRPDGGLGGWGDLTDLKGRPIGSITPHRVIIGPSGVWLVMVEPGIASHEVASQRSAAREQSISLARFLREVSFCRDSSPEVFKARAFLADPKTGSLHDVNDGRMRSLCELSARVGAEPQRLTGAEQRALVVALASAYPDSDREAVIRALDSSAIA
ncbi:MAG: hypothetical protein U1E29_14235 [Coriobacteriia bacterium]|nr:hypothetical protein [Coriobacteriia bacterium]